MTDTSFMASKVELVLRAFVAANRPLVRLLIGRGATFPVVAERLRQRAITGTMLEDLDLRCHECLGIRGGHRAPTGVAGPRRGAVCQRRAPPGPRARRDR